MLVEDVKPNRIEQAKRELWDFLRLAEGARVGLIAFSGVPFILCPLTTDHGSLATFLEALGVDLIPVLGTDLGAALELGLSAFDFKYESDRFLLVLSDGEDNEKKADEAARKAAKAGVKILTLGLGSPSGGPVPEGIVKRGFKKDKEGRVVLSKLDEEGLRHIAQLTGGRYVRSVVGDEDMKALSAEGMGEMKEGYDAPEGRIEVPLERFWVFAILAVLLLSLEYLLDERNGKPDLKRYDEAIG
jgi:Ca-activated chloride channel family protein